MRFLFIITFYLLIFSSVNAIATEGTINQKSYDLKMDVCSEGVEENLVEEYLGRNISISESQEGNLIFQSKLSKGKKLVIKEDMEPIDTEDSRFKFELLPDQENLVLRIKEEGKQIRQHNFRPVYQFIHTLQIRQNPNGLEISWQKQDDVWANYSSCRYKLEANKTYAALDE